MRGHPARAEVDLDVVARNVRTLAAAVAPADLCVVVKADGYGHGATQVAATARRHGATWIAVAHPVEASALRAAGDEGPLLLLSEPRPAAFDEVVAADASVALYTEAGIGAAAGAAVRAGRQVRVHLKVDTGMHRVGCRPDEAVDLAQRVVAADGLVLEGVWTHCAKADEPADPFTAEQSQRFERVLAELEGAGIDPGLRHQANSAGAIAHPAARRDLVRCGIAVYGVPPSAAMAGHELVGELRPAMRLVSEVSHVHHAAAGEGVSYGLRHVLDHDAVLATVPVGYGDGVPRSLGTAGGEVLVGGRRRPIRGVVTMDQLVVEVTDDPVAVGDEVVLLGRQGDEEVTALEWAELLGTIGYEVVTRIGPRVPRTYHATPTDPS